MGEIKSVGFSFDKCTSNLSSNLGESENILGSLYDSKDWTKRADCKSTPLNKCSKTLGVRSAKYNWDGTNLKGSEVEISSGCNGTEEEEEASSFLLNEASLTSTSGWDKGETIWEWEWDLVIFEGANLVLWSCQVNDFNLQFLYSP